VRIAALKRNGTIQSRLSAQGRDEIDDATIETKSSVGIGELKRHNKGACQVGIRFAHQRAAVFGVAQPAV